MDALQFTVMKQKNKVLYLYAGSRQKFYEDWKRGLVADTQLLGLNHMAKLGIDAQFIEWSFAEKLRRVSFNLVHIPYIWIIRRFDIVFICAGLPLVFLAKYVLRFKRPKFVIYNTYLTNALKRHPRGIIHFINRKAIKGIDCVVCTARFQEKFLIELGFDRSKIIFRPIGIDAKKFYDESQKNHIKASDTPYIASVGRDPGRDYKTLFEAVRGLPVHVKVATKPYAVAGLDIPPNVEVLYNIPYEEMPVFYNKALFAVVPLRDADDPKGSDTSGQYGFLEPMASGKAVIVSDKETVRDYLIHEKNAFLVKLGDAALLRSAIERLLSDLEIRKELAQEGQKTVMEKFTSERFAQSLAEIFKSI